MPPTDPTPSVTADRLTRALGEAVIMEQSASRYATSSIAGGGDVSRWIQKSAACGLPAWQASAHFGPIGQPSRNDGAGQPWG